MEIQIVKKEEKPLLQRIEVTARIAFEGPTPGKKQVVSAVAKATGARQETIIVRSIKTSYGDRSALVLANVYADRPALERLERQSMVKKNTFGEKKAEGEDSEAPAKKKEAE
jgi:small subunit ribosomal protein S24e